ncbi:hypothetical protein W02_07320 [Nitrospira sp. KM1]|uniref:hypothetical protein n=1 Tax=Nitrospira sp. KM1 TaxID=1936990 RepID=UPI0013A76164|nr:hypothetical protein [Nitrospira sp. KM1]BCA53592.1 hypothetical protein W02_07320 [Nitrospira sp. KM1]
MVGREAGTGEGRGRDGLPEDRILAVVQYDLWMPIEEVMEHIPDMSWTQLFLGVDILSRRGDVELRRKGFTYMVRLAQFSGHKRGEDGAAHHDHR